MYEALSVFLILGSQTFLLGFLSDLIAKNRRMIEEVNYGIRKLGQRPPSDGPPEPDEAPHS